MRPIRGTETWSPVNQGAPTADHVSVGLNLQAVQQRLGGSVRLPSLPRTSQRLKALLEGDDLDIEAVVEAIRYDPPLVAGLLRAVNGEQFDLSEEVLRPRKAVTIAGLKGLRNVSLRTPVFEPPVSAELRNLFTHSAVTARLCEELPEYIPAAKGFEPEDLHVYGLLHDLGQFAMFAGLGVAYGELWKIALSESRSFNELENELIGFSHDQLGAMLVARWGLPADLGRVTRCHHNDEGVAELDTLAGLIFVANTVAEHLVADSEVELWDRIPDRIKHHLGVEPAELEELEERALELAREVHSLAV